MIYFTNTTPTLPHLTFVGRWSPFHAGHQTIILSKLKEKSDMPILVMVRDREDEDLPTAYRAEQVKLWMQEKNLTGTIMIIPDVYGVYWGRKVGYEVGEVAVPKEVAEISGTAIRSTLMNGTTGHEAHIPSKQQMQMLSPTISDIQDRGRVIWLTGCPCSGKTTIAKALEKRLYEQYPFLKIQVLDGDVMRGTPIAERVGFSPEDRDLHIRRMGQLSKMFADHGILVIAAFVSPHASTREHIRNEIGHDRFVEVYVKADQETRIERDVKGMYAKAIAGKIENFTGFSAPYEEPTDPAVVCDTMSESVDESVGKIVEKLFTS